MAFKSLSLKENFLRKCSIFKERQSEKVKLNNRNEIRTKTSKLIFISKVKKGVSGVGIVFSTKTIPSTQRFFSATIFTIMAHYCVCETCAAAVTD